MKTKKTTYPPFNIATSFLLVIFIILCMIIFAVLSLSTALKDYHYSEKNAARTTAYYESNNKAEEILSEIDAILDLQYPPNQKIAKLEQLPGVSAALSENNQQLLITYNVPIDESELLIVSLETLPNQMNSFIITGWKQHSATEWTGDTSLPVLGSK